MEFLRRHREEIQRVAAAHDAFNVRVFGSVARGEASLDSDVDLLVDIASEVRGFAFFGTLYRLAAELSALLGVHVDVVSVGADGTKARGILHDAVAL